MRKLIPLIITCFIAAGLVSCDVTGEESFSFKPGNSLAIVGSSEVTLPQDTTTADTTDGTSVQASYYSQGFTIDKDYSWTVSGSARKDSVYRQGEYVDVSFTETGTYTISVDDGEYQGSLDVTVVLADE